MEIEAHKWNLLQQAKNRAEIETIFDKFRSRCVEPLLIKGLNAARFYPIGVIRQQTDHDIVIAEDRRELAEDIGVCLGQDGILVDLHFGMRHLDCTPYDEIFARSKTINIGESEIRVPSDEDHLRIVSTHWLGDGGEREGRIMDIVYAVENRSADFDWNLVFDNIPANRRKWVIYTMALANRLKKLDINEIPFRGECDQMPKWIEETVLRSWAEPLPLRDIRTVVDEKSQFAGQVKKRLFPNPIASTIMMDGDLDSRIISRYRVGWFLSRIKPLLKALLSKK